MKSSLLARMEKLELLRPGDNEAKRVTGLLFVGRNECIEIKLSGHPSQRENAQMAFHKIQSYSEVENA